MILARKKAIVGARVGAISLCSRCRRKLRCVRERVGCPKVLQRDRLLTAIVPFWNLALQT